MQTNYIHDTGFIETECQVINREGKQNYDRKSINFNDWYTAQICIRKSDISAFREDEIHTTYVALTSGIQMIVNMPYEQFKELMF